ncbi:energy transducer TonB [Tardiphaga sp.]|uniref:energy transducer TonB n=1 Tax=Tardiphaga sp. TaxID=1926292 RepID=UPI00352B13AC
MTFDRNPVLEPAAGDVWTGSGSDKFVGYRSSGRSRWVSILIVAAIHMLGLYALVASGGTTVHRVERHLVVTLLLMPSAPASSRTKQARRQPTEKIVGVISPSISMSAPQPIFEASEKAALVEAEVGPPRGPVAVASAPVPVGSLAAQLVSATPPRYPVVSRRKHEAGIVSLLVTVGEDGRAETVSIYESSGFERLDRAALSAVQSWRWLPTMVDGRPVIIRGIVRIPFELRGQ